MKHLASSSPILLLLLSAPAHAANCSDSISHAQARIDAAIERRAGDRPWQRESVGALRSHQPTPQSIASAEGAGSTALTDALAALDRARAADSAGDTARCLTEVSAAQGLLARSQQ